MDGRIWHNLPSSGAKNKFAVEEKTMRAFPWWKNDRLYSILWWTANSLYYADRRRCSYSPDVCYRESSDYWMDNRMANESFFAPLWTMSLAGPPTFILCLKMDLPLNDSPSIAGPSVAFLPMEKDGVCAQRKWRIQLERYKGGEHTDIWLYDSQPNPLHRSQIMLERMPTRCGIGQIRCTMSPIKKTGWQIFTITIFYQADLTKSQPTLMSMLSVRRLTEHRSSICTMDIWMSWTSKAVNQRNWQLPSHRTAGACAAGPSIQKSIFTLLRSRTMGKHLWSKRVAMYIRLELKKAKLWTFPILQERGRCTHSLPRRKMGRVLLRSVGRISIIQAEDRRRRMDPLTTTLDRNEL